MNKKSATQFKNHIESVVKELSVSHALAQESATHEELVVIRRSIGHVIAMLDELLHTSIYPDHPELNHLRE